MSTDTGTPPPAAGAARRPREDVRRNLESLLAAAKVVFANSGVNAPAKEITDRAGVGVGTLYRHFPKRSDLIIAVLRHELEDCVAAAETLEATHQPFDALTAWIDRFTELVGTKQGLAEAIHSPDPAYAGLPQTLLSSLEPAFDRVLRRGIAEGAIRPDVSAHDILLGVVLLCQAIPMEDETLNERMLGVFIDGLRSRPAATSLEG